jgi:hypothetical protein
VVESSLAASDNAEETDGLRRRLRNKRRQREGFNETAVPASTELLLGFGDAKRPIFLSGLVGGEV